MIDHDPQPDDLDAGLLAAFGPDDGITAMRSGESVVRRLGPWLAGSDGGDTPQAERSERDKTLMDDLAARGGDHARYEILEEIARGGMGVVIRGRDRDLGRDVAIKVLRARHADDPAMVRRFVEEAQIAGQLQHPGVLQVYDLGLREDRRPFFTMKLIRGETLSKLLADRVDPGSDRQRFLRVFESICQTMAYAHTRRVVHRDLKPANVMVGHFGEVQVVDWGLAKLVGAEEEPIRTTRSDDPSSQSMSGSVMGTPAYMSPEQALGAVDDLDERTDVFALGAILCEILTGRPPYTGEGADVLDAARVGRLGGAHARLTACRADDDLVEIARACLAVDAGDRPRDARVVADAVTAYLASVVERARASELAAAEARARVAEERRRRRLTQALAVAAVIVIALGGGLFGLVQEGRASDAERRLADTRKVVAQLEVTIALLDQARDAAPYEQTSWLALRRAGAHLQTLQEGGDIADDVRQRTDALLDEIADVDRDRRLVERIEGFVIHGATHLDRESWMGMERSLRQAFLDYGIDLDGIPRDEIAARIRRSPLAPQITDGLELWIATCAQLGTFGANVFGIRQLQDWARTLDEADPDPFRMAIRGQVWSGRPDAEVLGELAASPEFERALPRTQSWLAGAFAMAGDIGRMEEIFFRAIRQHSGDFMLNFDFAFHLAGLGRHEEAIRYYTAALALRNDNGGVWRSLGLAYREVGDSAKAIDALLESIRHQDDYAPTHVDLGRMLEQSGDRDAALAAYRSALRIAPDLAETGPGGPAPTDTWHEACRLVRDETSSQGMHE